MTVPTDGDGNPTQTITVNPIDGAPTVVIDFVAIDNAGKESTSAGSATITFTDLTVSGTVYDDPNGTGNSLIDGTAIGEAGTSQLYAILVSGGNVLASETVNTSSPIGSYSFGTSDGVQDNTSYTVVLSTTAGSVGNPPVITLPTGWVNTADGSGTGDGTPNGQFTAAVVASPETVDFGLDQLPTAGSGAATITNPGGQTARQCRQARSQAPRKALTRMER